MSDPSNPWPMLAAMATAAVVAAAVLLWPWRPRPSATRSVRCLLGVALGFYVGCGILGLWPRWPPPEDRDRMLLVLFPALIIIEILGAVLVRLRVVIWLLRLGLAFSAARVLLHHSVYLTSLPGPDSTGWTPAQHGLILGGLGLAVAAVWTAMIALARRAPGRALPLALALASAGTAVAVMLSGYATVGPLGLLLAAGIFGSVIASMFLPAPPNATGVLGFGIVGLFSLVVVGRFFGELTSVNAALLFSAHLMCWLPELPFLRRLGPRLRGVGRITLTALPLAIALLLIQRGEKPSETSPDAVEPGLEDYRNFGK
jgi:hypothetical protein